MVQEVNAQAMDRVIAILVLIFRDVIVAELIFAFSIVYEHLPFIDALVKLLISNLCWNAILQLMPSCSKSSLRRVSLKPLLFEVAGLVLMEAQQLFQICRVLLLAVKETARDVDDLEIAMGHSRTLPRSHFIKLETSHYGYM